ncbi:ABC transporter substrate-binding protein [Taklimakanibacter albus]|uniref:ABC transporter substrate-binding protein n=1 Tax=Taklimakanibacter albus TaxID=2800327 RepID=A0ACC5RAT7_9HYPH|nr:ABC transporter substrate-binding protein [Aestuariivirga sp. YIM B02566]MBK1869752.1 ABC transporter substrate-binding protein [Aestuariivirga sp. YIM B02566]
MKRLCTLVAAVLVSTSLTLRAQAEETINYITAGGIYLENIQKAYLDPVGKQLGIKWSVETNDVDTPVRVQVQSGAVTTDLVEFGASTCALGGAEGLYEKLDYSVIDNSELAPGTFSDYYVGSTIYSMVIAWNPKKVPNPPQNWADFWNVEKFPGTRSLYRNAFYVLEAALLADGVPKDKLYPLDLDRAFASLAKIKPHIKAWWASGAESQQLVREGGIDMIGMFNARAQSVISDGGSLAYTFNEGLIDFGCWSIVKGTPKKDLVMKVLAEFVKKEHQADMTLLSNYGAANTKIEETGKIPADLAPLLPTSAENYPKQIVTSAEWWAKHGAEAKERFDQFLAE